ncbi:hypothetical protein HPP92_004719 [Vanilla planifolia]|uniref:RING-type E3 ubiquitin transferase n=1 Tax=Vanilla planifolia TaxID=51239 RepID=A0A835VCI9_VANPL|nr:hypothetical protein HPP92_004719 [Vanilla planifolia]
MAEGQDTSPSTVAIAVDRDKGSQNAFKWALDNLLHRGQAVTLVHVNTKVLATGKDEFAAAQARELLVPFRCFCTRRNVTFKDVILEDTDIAKAIVEFVSQATVDKLVVGAPSKGTFVRLKTTDVPSTISKIAPDFCSVYVISKGKVSSVRNAIRPPPPVLAQPQRRPLRPDNKEKPPRLSNASTRGDMAAEEREMFRYGQRQTANKRVFLIYESNRGYHAGHRLLEEEEVEAEMKRLRLELKQTMDMYSNACKEALTAKHKAMELHRWKMEEEHRLEEARLAEEAALAMMEQEKAKAKAAIEAAEASKRIAELEARKRVDAEMKAVKEAEERKKAVDSIAHRDVLCRRYSIEEIEVATDYFAEGRKVGEGGYGPVYKGQLEHTPVAIKVLRPDAAQGRSQFQQEVEILSCIRHPNMVLLLGACPEFGCLVYEYMANGSLEDRLLHRGNTPPIPWQHRFRIAAEIGTGLLFLHQAKPKPLVHRDLKPANILLDNNYVSKISDVGLARLVPPSVADNVTQYRMTSTAGTFCYIDPEYQQTGMLGVKSDIYSFGILLLQLITGKPAMGLRHHVEHSIDREELEFLDPTVPDWPLEDALRLAKTALKCAELRRKDRPDLGKVVLPELNRLRELGENSMQNGFPGSSHYSCPNQSQVSMQVDQNTES